uniref:Uncharacterized protein LOC104210314 n=1 Tax=Nicotiana sylvestris TaxID=4096 RepID=A0A1U7UTF3_NICSY|nr:PREDICTED: uncharacterized protein LOC104210314 [Nicotiana sylvestris]
MKNGHWVNDASAELHDKVKEYIAEQIQEIEEDTDLDPVINAAFVKVVGETSSYCRGQGSGVNSTSRRSMNEIQEKLQAQQKEAEEERRKRESVECQLKEAKIKLEEERKNREAIMRDQKLLKESMMALASHILSNEEEENEQRDHGFILAGVHGVRQQLALAGIEEVITGELKKKKGSATATVCIVQVFGWWSSGYRRETLTVGSFSGEVEG